MQSTRHWDIFCQVIDNYGDAGVCWRLAADLAARGQTVRLWMDDASILQWLAPGPWPHNIEVRRWSEAQDGATSALNGALPDALVEAFGCEIPQAYLRSLRDRWPAGGAGQPAWVNLEYLSAEPYVERMHGLASPVMFGAAQGWSKRFFYPGFTTATGGLLRELNLLSRQQAFEVAGWRARLLQCAGVSGSLAERAETSNWHLLFSYESAALAPWLSACAKAPVPTVLLVAAGRSQKAFLQALPSAVRSRHPLASAVAGDVAPGHVVPVQWGQCLALLLPFMPQPDFDELLWASDFNIVRGEDSLVRALWAGKPFVWHIYPQHDNAHHAKLNAFLDWADAPACVCQAFHVWNGMAAPADRDAAFLKPDTAAQWRLFAQKCRERLLVQADLTSQLLGMPAVSQ